MVRGAKSPQITKKGGFSPLKFQGWYIVFFAGVVTLIEFTGSAVATCTYEAIEATLSVKFVASVKI